MNNTFLILACIKTLEKGVKKIKQKKIDKYRKYWKVSRAYYNFLKFFGGFTFKLVFYLEVIL